MRYWGKIIIFVLLLVWVLVHVLWQVSRQLPEELEGKSILIQGKVISDPTVKSQSTRFIFKTKEYGQIQLDWYRTKIEIKKGQHWQFSIRLKKPRNYKNPGGYDYERYMFLNRINATGYIDDRKDKKLITDAVKKTSLRQQIAHKIDTELESRPQAALIKGLTVGIRDTMTDAQWELLQRTGTSHLMAISGLHIGLVSGFMFFFGRLVWRCLPRVPLYVPAPIVGAVAAIVGAFFYAALAGFSIPTQRAFIMITVAMLCVCTRSAYKNRDVLFFAAVLVVLWDPYALLSPSFWLSFVAVALLFMIARQQAPKWYQFIALQWAISLGLSPLVIAYFQQISWISPLANLVAIPFASFFVVPFTLIGVFVSFISDGFAQFFWLLAESALNYLQWFLQGLADFKWSWQTYVVFDNSIWFAIIVGCLLLLLPKAAHSKLLGLILLATTVFVRHEKLNPQELLLTVLDVGQGLAVVVQTAEHVLVYDTGMRFDHFDLGEAVVMPFLRYQGIKKIDTLVLSHDNLDHTGGADYLIRNIPITEIISGESIKDQTIQNRCRAGQSWQWDQIEFKFLYPYRESMESNNNSCVLKITTGNNSILLAGDIEKDAELELISQTPTDVSANILLAPHHGSMTSSTIPFIKAVNPTHVIFATGHKNRYNFPKPEILKRYKTTNTQTHNTAIEGAIQFKLTPENIKEEHF